MAFYYFLRKEKHAISKMSTIYFSDFNRPNMKKFSEKTDNFFLLSLRNLSRDFEDGHCYGEFKFIRNQITHASISISENKNNIFTINLDSLFSMTTELFFIVKSALSYLTKAIIYDNSREEIMFTKKVLAQQKQK